MTGAAFNLDGLRMTATVTAPGGAINAETVFEFTQDDGVAEARYAGGRVRIGRLVGFVRGARFEFRYAQVHDDGTLHGGRSACDLERAEDGRVRIVEHYEWDDGGAGVNVIEELRRDTDAKA